MFVRIAAVILVLAVAACSGVPDRSLGRGSGTPGAFKIGNPYSVNGVTYTPKEDYSYSETGIASWYGPDFQGKQTANGESFDPNELTAAHRTLPMPSLVRVTNLDNGRSVVVRINDRGPFSNDRVIDLSRRAAQLLGFEDVGTAKVKVEIMPIESRAIADAARRRNYLAPTTQMASAVRTGQPHALTPTIMPVPQDQSGPEVQTASIGAVESAPLDAPVASAPLDAPDAPDATGTIDTPDQAASNRTVTVPANPEANGDKYDYAYGSETDQAPITPAPRAAPTLVKVAPPKTASGKTNFAQKVPMATKSAPAFVRDPKISTIPGKQKNGLFYPAPKVSHVKVKKGQRIYIQAGSFTVKENAGRLKQQLAAIAPATVAQVTVKGKKYYRVRLGPIKTVAEADKLLARVIPRDNTAHITVE